jgi:YD repeat-containing protein
VGNITSTTHEDGALWDYLYDERYRLTSAVRSNASETIEATYAYTYDDGDNMLTKVEPFEDDFNDSNYTGWTVTSGTWTATSNYLEATHATSTNVIPMTHFGVIRKAHTDADNEIVLCYHAYGVTRVRCSQVTILDWKVQGPSSPTRPLAPAA